MRQGTPQDAEIVTAAQGKRLILRFQARVGKSIAATPAPVIRERPCVEVTLHHASNCQIRTPELQRGRDGGEPGGGSTTVITPCTKFPSSRGGGIGECYDKPRHGANGPGEEPMSTEETYCLVHIPNQVDVVNVFRAGPDSSLALASCPPYTPTEVDASAGQGYSQLHMPMSPSAPELPYPSKAWARVGTPASMVRKSKSRLTMRTSHPRYRNPDGPLDHRARLRESDSLSSGARDIAANLGSHRVDRPVSLEGVPQVGNALLSASPTPDCRLSPGALPRMCAQGSTTVAATAGPQPIGHQEIDCALDALGPRDPSFSIPTPVELALPFANAPEVWIPYGWTSSFRNSFAEHARLTVSDHSAELPVSTFSALADALVMPSP
ncbi:hypothetical protein BD414DRAFT_488973 [Trametes punicea]|nr:hypothetical protein BD414DRAFT_488973 [Trametes punicea]